MCRTASALKRIGVRLGSAECKMPQTEYLWIEYSVASEPFNPLQRAIHSER